MSQTLKYLIHRSHWSYRVLPLVAIGLALMLALVWIPVALSANIHQSEDADVWTRLEVEKVFISRETTQAHRDTFSSAEFGWHIVRNGKRLARGTQYATFYFPGAPSSAFELVLVERDMVFDDVVATRTVQGAVGEIEFTANGDSIAFNLQEIRPDGNSGNDARADGARPIAASADLNASVSFSEGDYTDYYKTPATPITILVFKGRGTNIDWPVVSGGDTNPAIRALPESYKLEEMVLFESDGGEHLMRVRGAIGAGKSEYRIVSRSGSNREAETMGFLLNYSSQAAEMQSFFAVQDLSDLALEYNQQMITARCQNLLFQRGSNSETQRAFCGMVLYKNGEAADVEKLNERYVDESEFYKRTLRGLYRDTRESEEADN